MGEDAEREIAKLFHDYAETFNRDDVAGCQKFFAIPCTLISFGRALYVDSHEAFVKHWGATHQTMRESGISGGQIGAVKVFPLDADTALAGVIFERHGADGGVFNRSAGAYSLLKGEDGWKVVTFIMHAPEKWIGEWIRPSKGL